MAISRWGKKVEEVLSSEPEVIDVQEQITREALRLEVEQTKTYLKEWMERRLGRVFVGAVVSVRREEDCAWYLVSVDFRHGGTIYGTQRAIRDEAIDSNSTTTSKWSRFLDMEADIMTQELRKGLLANGVTQLSTNRLGMSTDLATLGTSYATTAGFFNQLGVEARKAQEAQEDLATTLEVQEAIDSIKQTIASREPERDQ